MPSVWSRVGKRAQGLALRTPSTIRVLGRRLSRSQRAERRLVHSHLKAPSVPRSPSQENTIAHTVQHLARQGIDAFLIADNGSTDGTADVLRSLAKEHCVHVLTDSLQDYLQGTKMTILAELARRQGADWIVPFDADELWFAGEGTVADFLRSSLSQSRRRSPGEQSVPPSSVAR